MNTRYLAAVGVASLICLGANAALAVAPTDAQKCEVAFELESGKYAQCRLDAEAKFTQTNDAIKLASALTKCATKLHDKLDKALARYGASCPPVEPESSLETYLNQCTADVETIIEGGSPPACGDGAVNGGGEQCDGGDLAGETCSGLGFPSGTLGCTPSCTFDTSVCAGACAISSLPATGQTTCSDGAGAPIPCAGTRHDGDVQAGATLAYVDNGDGTVTDVNTGLMWEKHSDDSSIHDRDNLYTWDEAFAVKVAALNAGSFAGHTDWRLPNIRELESILDYGASFPAVSPAFHTGCAPGCTVLTCSCTRSSLHYSSTHHAWGIDFGAGRLENLGTTPTSKHRVRAVRSSP